MNPWKPDDNQQQARRIGKTLEELAELSAVLARISIQGIDAIDPSSGKTNRQRMWEETADVLAQLKCNFDFFKPDFVLMTHRRDVKVAQMKAWEAHFDVVA